MLSDHQSEGTHLLVKSHMTIARISSLEILPSKEKAMPVQKMGKERSVIISKNELKPVYRGPSCAHWTSPLPDHNLRHIRYKHWTEMQFYFTPFLFFSPIQKKKKKSLISPQQHWPTGAKWSKFPWQELKTVWQVYRTCTKLTSEQKSLFSRGSCPLPSLCWHLKAGTSNEKFMQQYVSNIAMKDPQHLLTWANLGG